MLYNLGLWTLVRIVEVSVMGGVRFRRFHCSSNCHVHLPKLMCFDAAELAESEPAVLHFPSSSSSGSPNWLASRPFTLPPVSCLLGSSLDLSSVGSSGSDSMVEIESPEKMLMAEPFFLSAAMRLDPLLLPEVELCGFSGSLTCLR